MENKITGLKSLDKEIQALRAGEITLIGSLPYGGKTTLSFQLLETALKNNKNCLFVSLEMGIEQIEFRFDRFRPYIITDKNKKCKTGGNLFIFDQFLDIEETFREIRKFIKKEKVDLIVIDYFDLFIGDHDYLDKDASDELDMFRLKKLVEEINIPTLITLSLSNRKIQVKKKKDITIKDFVFKNVEKYIHNIIILHQYDKNNHVLVDIYKNGYKSSAKIKWCLWQNKYIEIDDKIHKEMFQINSDAPIVLEQRIDSFALEKDRFLPVKFYKFAEMVIWSKISISEIQRNMRIGYNQAKSILDELIERKIVVTIKDDFHVIDCADRFIEFAYERYGYWEKI